MTITILSVVILLTVGIYLKHKAGKTVKAPSLIKSEFYPDQLYVGKMVKLDASLKSIFRNALFGFPTDPLIVKAFNYFSIDDNKFEEIVFDKIGVKNYIMLHDSFENINYFLNRLMTQAVDETITQDAITLNENDKEYVYNDMSGLIEVNVSNHQRLIRVYSRDITADDQEFLVLIQDKPDVIDFYIGFNISVLQLEDTN